MRKLDFWVKSCLGKKVYKTEKKAQEWCKKMNIFFDKHSRYYYCDQCCFFHLTTASKQVVKVENTKVLIPVVKKVKDKSIWKDLRINIPLEGSKLKVRDNKYKVYNVVYKLGSFIKESTKEEVKNVFEWTEK